MPSGAKGRGYPQDIHTPQEVCDVVYEVFGGDPTMDPFGSPKQLMRADRVLCGTSRKVRRLIEKITGDDSTRWWCFEAADGWVIAWYGDVYLNPEFERLGEALERAWREVHREGGAFQAIVLGPIRTHRTYAHWFWAANECCFMRPIAFVGYGKNSHFKGQFPLPLGLSYYGPHGERFRRAASRLGVVRSLTPWTNRIIMPPMSDGTSLAADLEQRRKALIVDVARDHPQLSITQILDQLDLPLGSEDAKIILNTPLQDLVAAAPEPVRAAPTATNGVAAKNGHSAKKRTPKAAKKAPPNRADNGSNGHVRGGKESQVPSKLEAFLAKKKKGDEIKTSEFIDVADVGRAAVLKHLSEIKRIKMYGSGRGAVWRVVA